MRQNLANVFVSHQPVAHGRAVLRRDQDIEIADRVTAPTIAARHDDALAIA
jgi:hypothetical protein